MEVATVLDLNRIRHFLVLSEELSFSAAARRLYLDQATLSRSVRSLEKDLGVDLFGRTSRKVWLTAAGHELVEEARRLVALAEAFRQRAAALAEQHRCDIRIDSVADDHRGERAG